MIQLLGEYDCKVDAKGRIRVPSGLAKQLEECCSNSFILNRALQKHIMLYPKSVWDAESKKVNALSDFRKESLDFKRWWYGGVVVTQMDSADRILIPRKLLDFAGIEGEVTMIAVNDRIEIWSTSTYEANVNQDPESFLNFAENLLGGEGTTP
ncbi:MAG: division/cell wall cluster transcriptional repressor MraZ [Bacteroidia bacterium]|nr:division/cell wall cluster transcriptional repressor MraZ [Bacteroidia bacterium]